MARRKILIVEDDDVVRSSVASYLERHSCSVMTAPAWAEAHELLRNFRPEVAIVDYSLPDGTALDALPSIQDASPDTAVVILTGHGSIDLAVRAMKEGAEHFLTKPIELNTLRVLVERIAVNRTSRRLVTAGRKARERESRNPFLGASAGVRQLEELSNAVVDTDRTVLILGETGAGKGQLARWFHERSPRREEPLVELNCSGLSRELLETELFGHEKGAFTGATSTKQGLLEAADRGTMFLDEIGDVDPVIQPKLLKVIEEKSFRRVGDVRERHSDVRLIAATHHDLPAAMKQGRFRADLYFRLSVFPLSIPPLRERREDIEILARHLLIEISADLARPLPTLTDAAVESLRSHTWPGNIRELRNVLERAVLIGRGSVVDRPDLSLGHCASGPPAVGDPRFTLSDVERMHTEAVLAMEHGNVDAAARRLGLSRSTLYARIKAGTVQLSSEARTNES